MISIYYDFNLRVLVTLQGDDEIPGIRYFAMGELNNYLIERKWYFYDKT